MRLFYYLALIHAGSHPFAAIKAHGSKGIVNTSFYVARDLYSVLEKQREKNSMDLQSIFLQLYFKA